MIIVLGGKTGSIGQEISNQLSCVAASRLTCDVESEDSVREYFKLVTQTAPSDNSEKLHIINATGVSLSSLIHKTELSAIEKTLRVNLTSNLLILKHAREAWKSSGGGSLIMMGSVTASTSPAGAAIYSASKAALRSLASTAAREYARLNVRVNVLELGYFDQGMISQVPNLDQLVQTIPLGRLGAAADLGSACKFLIDCQYVTGATIPVNGGLA